MAQNKGASAEPTGLGAPEGAEPHSRLVATPAIPSADPALAWRVAMAIYREYENRPVYAQGQMNGVLAAELAVAAIKAMREPTDAMIEAAAATPGIKACNDVMFLHQARGYGFATGSFDGGSPLHQAWRAMVDAATVPVYDVTAASAIEAPSGVETGNTDSTEGESAVGATSAETPPLSSPRRG